MGAKMSEAERRLRYVIETARKLHSPIPVKTDELAPILSELDRLRAFSEEIREAHTFIVDHGDFDEAVTKALEKLDARATGGEAKP